MEHDKRALLVDAIVTQFTASATLTEWVRTRIADTPVDDILRASTLTARALDLIEWAEAQGREAEVLQLLVNQPPVGVKLEKEVYYVSRGAISRNWAGALPPVDPHDDWFAMQRPFVNRDALRLRLRQMPAARPGPESILIVEGPSRSGKTHGVFFAKQCAPHLEFSDVDIEVWGTTLMTAADLTKAIYPTSETGFPAYDETKEAEAVPRLLLWLTGKFRGANQTWILFDHLSRPNLTAAATDLFIKFVDAVQRGNLPSVRLIIADADLAKLPRGLRARTDTDVAALPTRASVEAWCATLAAHHGRACDAVTLGSWVDSVFAGLPAQPSPDVLSEVLEDRLIEVVTQIKKA